MVRVAYVVCGDVDLARDSAQAAWVRAWQRLDTIREPTKLRAWLVAIAAGPQAYAQVSSVFASIPGRIVLFLFTWSLVHHMLGGIRHLIWDTGRGLNRTSIEVFAWFTILGSTALTILIWYAGYALRGS